MELGAEVETYQQELFTQARNQFIGTTGQSPYFIRQRPEGLHVTLLLIHNPNAGFGNQLWARGLLTDRVV